MKFSLKFRPIIGKTDFLINLTFNLLGKSLVSQFFAALIRNNTFSYFLKALSSLIADLFTDTPFLIKSFFGLINSSRKCLNDSTV